MASGARAARAVLRTLRPAAPRPDPRGAADARRPPPPSWPPAWASTAADRGPYDWAPGPVFDLAFELAGAPERPRLCYLGTATGDDPARVAGVYGAFAGSAVQVSHLSLFPMPTVPDVRAHLLAQDVVWVGGGSVANLLAVWRVHGLDEVFREVLGGRRRARRGVAPARCAGTSAAPPTPTAPTCGRSRTGSACIPTSNGVHYDSEEQRRPLYHRLVADGTLPAGHATDDGVGLVYRGTELVEAVADRPGHGGLPGRARPGRHGGRDPPRAPPAALSRGPTLAA